MKVRIEIDTKTFVRFWLVVIGFGLAGLTIYAAREALMILGAALFLALALSYPVKKLVELFPGKSRLAGTAAAFGSLVLILGAVIWFVVPPLVQQSAKFADNLPAMVDQISNQWHGFNDFVESNNLRPQLDATIANIKAQASGWAASVGSGLLSSLGSLAAFLASLFLVIVLSFLMLLEGPEWMARLWGLYRDQQKMARHKELIDRMYSVVTGYVNGQLTVSGIGALMAGGCVFVLSFFFPVLEANLAMPTILIVFILSLIPMFGATLAGIMVTLLLAISSWSAGLVYAIFFIIYQQIENNFISPVIQSKRVELSALAVLTAVTVGLYVGGLAGGVIAIPVAGSLKVLLEYYLAQKEVERQDNDKPLKKMIRKLKADA
ncbi:MAG: AI-2E family transporter [Candidatus Saccharibacteria bacterium]|nr:AI-2E family transporter [Candidatus Saccharibacteria bacterium]